MTPSPNSRQQQYDTVCLTIITGKAARICEIYQERLDAKRSTSGLLTWLLKHSSYDRIWLGLADNCLLSYGITKVYLKRYSRQFRHAFRCNANEKVYFYVSLLRHLEDLLLTQRSVSGMDDTEQGTE